MNNTFLKVEEVAEMLGVSKSYAYKVVRQLNDELKEKQNATLYRRHRTFTGCRLCRALAYIFSGILFRVCLKVLSRPRSNCTIFARCRLLKKTIFTERNNSVL